MHQQTNTSKMSRAIYREMYKYTRKMVVKYESLSRQLNTIFHEINSFFWFFKLSEEQTRFRTVG